MTLSKVSKILITLWMVCLAGFITMPIQSAEQYRYQLFPDSVVVLDSKNVISVDIKNKNFGQLGQYKFSLDGSGFAKLKANKLILAKDNLSGHHVLLTGKISVKYKRGIDVNQLVQDYGLSISSHFANIHRVFLEVNSSEKLQYINKMLLNDNRVLNTKLDMVDYNQFVR
jgi:hypothetical protein